MAKLIKYTLVESESCDWYVIPVSKMSDWEEWSNLDSEDEAAWDVPEWAKYVQDPGHVEFTNWKCTL